jgi:predicted transcriptional regulator of viral defense system
MAIENYTLGPNELRLLFTLEKEGKTIFGFSDARRVLGTTDASTRNVLYRLRKKGRVEEIQRGKYLLVPARAGFEGGWAEAPYAVVPHLVKDHYVGFWSALNHWGMTEQSPRSVFVATTKRKRDVDFGPTRFEFVTLAPMKFFGFVEDKVAGGTFNVSTREKTIVDCLALPKYCGGLDEAAKGVWNARQELDFAKTLRFAQRYGVDVVVRRLGYVLSLLHVQTKLAKRIAKKGFNGFMWLDPLGPKKILGYSKEYGLILNRTREELLAWRGT